MSLGSRDDTREQDLLVGNSSHPTCFNQLKVASKAGVTESLSKLILTTLLSYRIVLQKVELLGVISVDLLQDVGNPVTLDDTSRAPDTDDIRKVDIPVLILGSLCDDLFTRNQWISPSQVDQA
jgi:hypothetical protein